MMVGEGMLQGGTVSVTMKKNELSFEIKKKGRKGMTRETVMEKKTSTTVS